MRAVHVASQDADDPLSGLVVGELSPPQAPEGWVPVDVRAASLNHHDLWSLRGVGLPAEKLPMILGTDAAGTDPEGREVVVHAVITAPDWRGDETLDPTRSLLSEHHPGTLADRVWVPPANLVAKPPELGWEEAASLPTAYLTAYRLLFNAAALRPGQSVLVQGTGGGVASAAIVLGRAAGLRVWASGRDEQRRARALDIGAHETVASGERLPEKVDAVIETVGEATWGHSLRALRPGGVVAVAGATTGAMPPADLNRVFFRSLRIVGSTMGTRDELESLLGLLAATGARPVVDSVWDLDDAAAAVAHLASGNAFGKVVITP